MLQKIKVQIGIIGFLPFDFDWKFIKKYKSDVFEIVGDIGQYCITSNADTSSWGYSDSCLEKELSPISNKADFFIGVTSIRIEDNYYARRLSSNKIVLTYFEMYQLLQQEHIPVENFLLRAIYRYALVFLRQKKIPIQNEWTCFHHDSRGCIFDMNGHKSDVIWSLDRPKICDECIGEIRKDKVSDNDITQIKKELLEIRKRLFYRIAEWTKERPILSIIISAVGVIVLNLISDILWNIGQ